MQVRATQWDGIRRIDQVQREVHKVVRSLPSCRLKKAIFDHHRVRKYTLKD